METFKEHGFYTLGNAGGYLVEISDCGECARLKESWGNENPQITDWLPIESVELSSDDDNYGSWMVIDPNGYDIPLDMVMRINR